MIKDREKLALRNDETNEALGVAGRGAWSEVPGYGGSRGYGGVAVRSFVPGYSGSPKRRAEARHVVPGYGTVPVAVRITRLPNL